MTLAQPEKEQTSDEPEQIQSVSVSVSPNSGGIIRTSTSTDRQLTACREHPCWPPVDSLLAGPHRKGKLS